MASKSHETGKNMLRERLHDGNLHAVLEADVVIGRRQLEGEGMSVVTVLNCLSASIRVVLQVSHVLRKPV